MSNQRVMEKCRVVSLVTGKRKVNEGDLKCQIRG